MKLILNIFILLIPLLAVVTAWAAELGKAVSKRHIYGCVPYIKHPRAKDYATPFSKSMWNKDTGTFQCYYHLGDDVEYKAPEGRLIITDPIKKQNCRYHPKKSQLICEGKS